MTTRTHSGVFHAGQHSFAHSLLPNANLGIHRFGKQRRAFNDPIETPKTNPYFVPPPPTNNVNLNLPMSVVLPHENTVAQDSGKLVFHCVGDTGGVHGDDVQVAVANAMEAQIKHSAPADRPAFFYHLGDVVYFNGLSNLYGAQFYEPYKFYPAAIFAIPGNHDGDIRTRPNDPPDKEPSLRGFIDNFVDTRPTDIHTYRPTMTQPYVYWTLETPFVNIIGLYSNVEGLLDARGTNEQQRWFEDQMSRAPAGRFLFIAVHHPPFSLDAVHGGYIDILTSIDRAASASGRVPDAILSGHVHSYQRFSRQIGAKNVPFIVAGAGGYANRPGLMHRLMTDDKGKVPVHVETQHNGHNIGVKLEGYEDLNPGFLKMSVSADTFTAEYFSVPFDDHTNVTRTDSVEVRR